MRALSGIIGLAWVSAAMPVLPLIGPSSLVPLAAPSSLPEPPPLKLGHRVVHFNVMVAGLSGLGKTSACERLFAQWREAPAAAGGDGGLLRSTTAIDSSRVFTRACGRGVELRVTLVDTPGFGHAVDARGRPARVAFARGAAGGTRAIDAVRGFVRGCFATQMRRDDSPDLGAGALARAAGGLGERGGGLARAGGECIVHCCV